MMKRPAHHFAGNSQKGVQDGQENQDQEKQQEEIAYNPDQALTKPRAETSDNNLINQLYFGVAEKTIEESSYYPASMYKPYNPDSLYQKTGDYSIFEEMLDDDQVSVCMQIKKDLVVGSGWDIITESDDDLHIEIKEDLEQALGEDPDSPFEDQLESLLSAYEFGFSLSEKIFQNRPDGSLTLKGIKTRHPSTWLIHTNKYGNVFKYEQRGRSETLDIDPKSLIHYINNDKFQNVYGVSDLKTAYAAWFTKRQVIRYYAIFLEKAASPTPIARYDKNAPQSAVDNIYNAIKRLQTKTALVVPKEIELMFLESKTEGQAFSRAMDIFNMFIGRSLMIPDLMGFQGGETQGGAYSLGKKQLEVLFTHIQRRRSTLERHINKHIIYPIVVYNWGMVPHYPKFRLKPIDDEVLVDLAKLWVEAMKGRVYQPTNEEINHFRKLAKFPEGDVILPNSVSATDGTPSQQPGPSSNPYDNPSMPTTEPPGGMMATNSKKTFKQVYGFPPGDYYKKVDFKLIGNHLDSFTNAVTTEAYPVVKKIYQDLYDQIEQKKIIQTQNPDKLDSLKVKYLKELKIILKNNMREAYTVAGQIAQSELLKGNFKKSPLPSDEFMNFLESESFQYIGDWSYNVSKQARLAMIEAIKDGKPLSSVIDELENQGLADSMTSIERYARTKFTEVTNKGRLAYYESTGIVAAYQFSAILDDRTTDVCAGLDGKIFDAGDEPVPPLHFNCRSLLIPITKYEDYEPDTKVGKIPINQFIDDNKGSGFSKQ